MNHFYNTYLYKLNILNSRPIELKSVCHIESYIYAGVECSPAGTCTCMYVLKKVGVHV